MFSFSSETPEVLLTVFYLYYFQLLFVLPWRLSHCNIQMNVLTLVLITSFRFELWQKKPLPGSHGDTAGVCCQVVLAAIQHTVQSLCDTL